MKNQLTELQFHHEIIMREMQLQSKLAKMLEDLLRRELSQVETSIDKKQNVREIELHCTLAKRLERQLCQALSRVDESFNEMESFSVQLLNLQKELLGLQKEENLNEPELQKGVQIRETISL